MSTLYSVGQMNQLADALEAAGYTPDDVTKMRSKPEELTQFKAVLIGASDIVAVKHVIDCDCQPFVPENWEVCEDDQLASRVTGQLEWDAANIGLFLSDTQKSGRHEGNELRKELESQPALPANLLDYLLEHPHLIPEEWKGKYVFFWGTIYRYSDGDLFVRCLGWRGGRWCWDFGWLGSGWRGSNPAAVLAS